MIENHVPVKSVDRVFENLLDENCQPQSVKERKEIDDCLDKTKVYAEVCLK